MSYVVFRIEKYRSKKAKMRVKPAVFRDSDLKKQSQFISYWVLRIAKCNLIKQSQCQNRQCGVNSIIVKIYVCFGVFWRSWMAKNKPNSKPIRLFYRRERQVRGGFWCVKTRVSVAGWEISFPLRSPRTPRLIGVEKTKPISKQVKWT